MASPTCRSGKNTLSEIIQTQIFKINKIKFHTITFSFPVIQAMCKSLSVSLDDKMSMCSPSFYKDNPSDREKILSFSTEHKGTYGDDIFINKTVACIKGCIDIFMRDSNDHEILTFCFTDLRYLYEVQAIVNLVEYYCIDITESIYISIERSGSTWSDVGGDRESQFAIATPDSYLIATTNLESSGVIYIYNDSTYDDFLTSCRSVNELIDKWWSRDSD